MSEITVPVKKKKSTMHTLLMSILKRYVPIVLNE